MGDAIGRWEGDTLVVETTNFREDTGLYGGDQNLYLTERFTPLKMVICSTIYSARRHSWTQPWSGAYVWKREQAKVYEYACHEGNYAMGNILRGARLLESEAQAAGSNHRVASDI